MKVDRTAAAAAVAVQSAGRGWEGVCGEGRGGGETCRTGITRRLEAVGFRTGRSSCGLFRSVAASWQLVGTAGTCGSSRNLWE